MADKIEAIASMISALRQDVFGYESALKRRIVALYRDDYDTSLTDKEIVQEELGEDHNRWAASHNEIRDKIRDIFAGLREIQENAGNLETAQYWENKFNVKNSECGRLGNRIGMKMKTIANLESQIQQKDCQITQKDDLIFQKSIQISNQDKLLSDGRTDREELKSRIVALEQSKTGINSFKEVKQKNTIIANLNNQLSDRTERLSKSEAERDVLRDRVARLEKALSNGRDHSISGDTCVTDYQDAPEKPGHPCAQDSIGTNQEEHAIQVQTLTRSLTYLTNSLTEQGSTITSQVNTIKELKDAVKVRDIKIAGLEICRSYDAEELQKRAKNTARLQAELRKQENRRFLSDEVAQMLARSAAMASRPRTLAYKFKGSVLHVWPLASSDDDAVVKGPVGASEGGGMRGVLEQEGTDKPQEHKAELSASDQVEHSNITSTESNTTGNGTGPLDGTASRFPAAPAVDGDLRAVLKDRDCFHCSSALQRETCCCIWPGDDKVWIARW